MMRLESALLREAGGTVHGFFGRDGGVSEGPWASLNMSLSTGDDPARVLENRRRAAATLGAPGEALLIARQVHGTTCVVAEFPWAPDAAPEADAIVTRMPGIVIGVTSADCAPVLLADPEAGVIGAAHAGWRGALDGIVDAVVGTMAALGADLARTVAVVGPCIARAAYEVGPEFRERFLQDDPASEAFFLEPRHGGRPRFDLEAYVTARLARAGVGRVQALGVDTCSDPARFFSFRRTTREGGGPFGTQLSAIARRG
jgi:YfiH family protein